MNKKQIIEAIKRAERGIGQYLEIMELFPSVNVAKNTNFQRKFKAFYRVRQRPAMWYKIYFSFMQRSKEDKPTFDRVIDHLNRSLGRYEPSFSSKMVATLDPEQPIWDAFVLKNTNTIAPSYQSRDKLNQAKSAYRTIQDWYREFLDSGDGKRVVRIFNENVKKHAKITNLKKVDFVLWQTRT